MKRAIFLALIVSASACGDSTVLTGPDAEAAAERFQAEVRAETESDARRPVIFLDGERVARPANEILRAIDPTDIERIEVMKACAAMSRLGEEGRNGFVVIYTKSFEGERLEFEERYPELGEACRRDVERERNAAWVRSQGDDWPPPVEPIGG